MNFQEQERAVPTVYCFRFVLIDIKGTFDVPNVLEYERRWMNKYG